MSDGMQTAWIWPDEAGAGMMGASVDVERGLIQWTSEPGCGCAGSDAEQPIADFLAHGPRFLSPPEDVVAAMRAALATWDQARAGRS